MSSETLSLLLRPACVPSAHHAAVTSCLLLDGVELLNDASQYTASSHTGDAQSALPDRTTSASSWLASLSQPGSTVHRPARSLVTASRDATIRLWHVREEEEEGAGVRCCGLLEGHTEWVSDLALLGDQRTLVSSSADSLIKLWDLQTGLCTQTLAKHTDYVECLAYAHSARLLASAGLSNQLYLWRLDASYPTPTECLSLPGHTGEQCHSLYALDMTSSGNLLATGGTDKVVRCWDTRSGSVWSQLLGHERLVRGVRLKDDGWQAVSVSADNVIRQWDLRKQRCIATFHIKDSVLSRTAAVHPASLSAKPSTCTFAVSDTFHKAYTGHSTGAVVCTDLGSGRTEPIVALSSAAITVRLDHSRHQLWCASFDSAVTCWDVRPSMTRHASFDAEDDDDDEPADEDTTLLQSPVLSVPGCPPLRRIKVTGDGWHVLAQDAHSSVQLWDVVNQRMVKDYGVVSFDELLNRKNASLASQRPAAAVPSWFTLDLRLGCLCVNLTKQATFAARYTIPAPPMPDESADSPADVSICLGESCLTTAFKEWLGLERLAWKVQMGEVGDGADDIEETDEQASYFSPLLSPKGNQQTAPVAPLTPTVPACVVVGVAVSMIVSFPRSQRRTALYQSLPIPPLPVSLAPRLPSSSSSVASFEESMLELDRRRAVYFQLLPSWVESGIVKADEPRPQRPAEDLLPDPFVTVNEWGFGDEDEEHEAAWDDADEADDGVDDHDESQASHVHDSLSVSGAHLWSAALVHIHHSPASRPRLSPSPQLRAASHAGVLLHQMERGVSQRSPQRRVPHSPSASPSSLSSYLTLQHPSIPKALSHPHLLHFVTNSNSPLQRASLSSHSQTPAAFDLSAPTYNPQQTDGDADTQSVGRRELSVPTAHSAQPRTLFYLQPLTSQTLTVLSVPSPPSSPASGGLPAVFHGPLLVPDSMSILRIRQYLHKKLNNSPALTKGVEGEEVTLHSLRLLLTDGREVADSESLGDVAASAQSEASKEKALRIWYGRDGVQTQKQSPDVHNALVPATDTKLDVEEPSSESGAP